MKRRIKFVVERYWPARGGIEEAAGLFADLCKKDFEVLVVTHQNHSYGNSLFNTTSGLRTFNSYADPNGIKVLPLLPGCTGRIIMLPIMMRHFIGVRRLVPQWSFNLLYNFYHIAFKKRLSKIVADSDVVLCFSGGYLGILTQKICHRIGIPIGFISSIHPNRWDDSTLAIKAYRKSSFVNTNTHIAKSFLISKGVPEKIIFPFPRPIKEYVIPGKHLFINKYGAGSPTILFVGRREPYKGLDLLLEVFPKVIKTMPLARLVIIGPGKKKESAPYCIDLGETDDQEKQNAYAACDIVCVPSQSESLGMVYLEAWYNSKPVIACPIPEILEIIDHGENGILVEPNRDSLLAGLVGLCNDRAKQQQMGNKGRKKYDLLYSNRIIYNDMLNLINSLLLAKSPDQ
jgi:phosphatidylinositol alpha-1,6-mannosyltransferase